MARLSGAPVLFLFFFHPPCVCVRMRMRTEEAARAGGETVRLIWIQALAPRGPVHCGPPTRHCNFISCRGDNECVPHQHIKPLGRRYPRGPRVCTPREHKGLQLCTCMRKHGNPLTHFSHSLSHVPTLFPPSSAAPPRLFSHW